ncbi:GTPase Era, mitochondrial-like [Haliotis cracherodii]|uniref:GTPase Era, mitochondrial-like n=1 Tax=Haliotis cracherodii TaxID=6455 RepID=UPI0039EAD13A
MAAPMRSMVVRSRLTSILSSVEAAVCVNRSVTWCCRQYHYTQRHLTTQAGGTGSLTQTSATANSAASTAPNQSPRPSDIPDVHQAKDHMTSGQQRDVSMTKDGQHWRLLMEPDQPPGAKVLRVAIIGVPNSGKSTLTNRLMGWKVSAVSKKVHTTRRNSMAVHTEGNTQIVFIDTPGIMHPMEKKRHGLEKSHFLDPARSLEQADLVGVLVDVSDAWKRDRLDPVVLRHLHLRPHVPSVLILNKIDSVQEKETLLQCTRCLTEGIVNRTPIKATPVRQPKKEGINLKEMFDRYERDAIKSGADPSVTGDLSNRDADSGVRSQDIEDDEGKTRSELFKKRHILPLGSEVKDDDGLPNKAIRQKIRQSRGWPHFDRVFMVSAQTGDGIKEVKDYLMSCAGPGDWEYHSSVVTEDDTFHIARTCVWEKLLDNLPDEIPYQIYPEIIVWEVDEHQNLDIVMDIVTQRPYHLRSLVGRRGETIRLITAQARQEIMNVFRCDVRLHLQARIGSKLQAKMRQGRPRRHMRPFSRGRHSEYDGQPEP